MPTQMFELGTTRFEPYPVKTVNGVRRRDWRVYTLSDQGSWVRVGIIRNLRLNVTRDHIMRCWRTWGTMPPVHAVTRNWWVERDDECAQ